VAFEVLESFIPSAAILKFDIQMLSVEPKHFDGRQQCFRFSPFLLSTFGAYRFCPTLINAVAKTQSAVVLKVQDGLGEILVYLDR
jgi:hypothetical protein